MRPDRYDSFIDLVENARADLVDSFQNEIVKLCTLYLTESKRPDNSMECAVGNFHVRNGATLWRINFGIQFLSRKLTVKFLSEYSSKFASRCQ